MWLDFKITDRCNNNCTYCFDKHISPNSKEKLNSLIIKKCLEHSIKVGFKKIALFGGEPSLRDDLHFIINNLSLPHKNDITLFFISNGVNFNHEVIETIFNSKFKHVVYVQSLDSLKSPNYKNQEVDKILEAIFFTKSLCNKYNNPFQKRNIEINTVI